MGPHELEAAGAAWEARVNQIVSANAEIAHYVRQLESALDQVETGDGLEIPSGEALASELERFLREQEGGGGQDKSRGPA
jgi:hypothetical protein